MSLHDNFSSKLKRVFIELHNYSYYHGPSDDKQPDSRFIGRKRQMEKLKSVLTDTERDSGTYLIAGYRGMGKTSFVNKVIESIYTPVTLFSRLGYLIFVHLLIFTVSISLLNELNSDNTKINNSNFFLYSFILFALIYFYNKYSSRFTHKNLKSRKHLVWSEWFLLLLITLSIVSYFFIKSDINTDFSNIRKVYYTTLFILLLYIGLVRLIIYMLKKKRTDKKNTNIFKELKERIIQFVNYSDRINIKLNLGYSNLQEIDILRLIARNILISFKKYRRTYSFNWFLRAFLILGIFLLSLISWRFLSKNQSYYSLLQNTGISTIFPSQQQYYLEKDTTLKKVFRMLQSHEMRSINHYLSYTHYINNKYKNNNDIKDNEIENYIKNDHIKVDTESKNYEFLDSTENEKLFYKKILSFKKISFIKEKLLAITCYVDYALSGGYFYLMNFTYLNKISLIPKSLHYLFFLYFLFFLWIFRICSRIVFNNKTPRNQVIKNLQFLNELIDSNVSKDTAIGFGFIQSRQHMFTKNKSLNYQKADVREIEKRLIEIIDDIGELPVYSYKAKFTIVFDELDKIETYLDTQDKKEKHNNENTQTPESIRKRLQTVMELLSNLKYFLSTAQAKFIFIAGRELYDASLADVTDRNFRLGSIFHDTIYLNSFFTDLDAFGVQDITSRTENYVCRYLFPEDYFPENYSLKEYNKYLLEKFPDFDESKQDTISRQLVARQKREKVIHLLQQFIVYLNHISAGAPSKITAYFENYIITKNSVHNFNEESCLLVGKRNKEQYLFFDFYHQYKIGVFDHLLTPFNFSINKAIRNYGDKLIISASFLHDHLLKFHRNAFSWRDLEATPEMVDVNKNPELRDFLGIVMDFMLKTHIQEILNGLYDFKFPKKVAQEINYLSHVSEEASAIFNFTLDESLSIKQHFLNKLIKLDKEDIETEEQKNKYQFARSSIYVTIGDLCFYDEDMGDAMINYLEAISSIRNLDVDNLSITQMAILTRNMLKLAHTMEKRRTYDMAYLTYNEIWEKISCMMKSRYKLWYNDLELTDAVDNIKYFYQPLLAKLHLTEKTSLDGINFADLESLKVEFDKLNEIIQLKEKQNIYVEFWNKAGDILYYKYAHHCKSSKSIFSDHYQCDICNIKDHGKMKCFACKFYFDGLNRLINKDKKPTEIKKEIYSNLIDFLRKNKSINQHESKVLAMTFSDLGDVFLSCSLENKELISLDLFKRLQDKIIEYVNDHNPNTKYNDVLEFLNSKNKLEEMLIFYHLSAIFYKKSGDDKNFAFQFTKILYFIKEYAKREEIQTSECREVLNTYLEYLTTKSINSIYRAYDYIHVVEIARFKNIFNNDNDYLIHKEISLNMGSINAEIDEIIILYQKIKLRLYKKPEEIKCPLTCYGINNSMYNRFLKLKLKAEINRKYFDQIINYNKTNDLLEYVFNHPCDKSLTKEIIDSFISRINDNEKYMIYQEEAYAQDAIEFCITDSIFCYYEMLKIFNTFGVSFHLNYSTLAEIHEKLYLWSELYDYYCIMNTYSNFNQVKDQIKRNHKMQNASKSISYYNDISLQNINLNKENSIVFKLQNLIEPDNLPSVTASYNCEKAVQAYQLAIETHHEGRAYRDLLENMYYLNDDYNDKLYHFSVALERYKDNNQVFQNRISKLKDRMSKSSLYQTGSYTRTIVTHD